MMEQEKDPRFRKLSTLGAVLNFLGALIALVAVVSNSWASLNGASYIAAAAAVLTTIALSVGAVLAFLVVSMHHAKHEICVKFRHATFTRMIISSSAAMMALISIICFLLEAKVFLRMQSSHRTRFSWGFYLEILAFFMASAVGMIAGIEWRWSRKLGGDPTIYTRDQDGTKADTIVNPNFREAPRTRSSDANPKKSATKNTNLSRGGGVTRNSNGIAMTATSGQPYMLTTNGRPANGTVSNGRPPAVAFDPRRIPGRSSLRRPKPRVNVEDQPDTTDLALHNPTFANTSPTPKKKVRIYTQSTAV